mmetsp:Transcript_15428/g.42399  ORF Transcript_15428/g.42399 Transcript_15428/m.42399 type:complete len:304 (-) Transcript_15428:1567-2478(-)
MAVMKPSISRRCESTNAQSCEAGCEPSRDSGSNDRRISETKWRNSRRTCATCARERCRWYSESRAGVNVAHNRANRDEASTESWCSLPLRRSSSISLSVPGHGGSLEPKDPQTWRFAKKHLRRYAGSSLDLPNASSKDMPLALKLLPTMSKAERMISAWIAIQKRTSSTCSSSHCVLTTHLRPSARGREDATSCCVSSSPMSIRTSVSTAGFPTTGCLAGRLASRDPRHEAHWCPSDAASSRSQMPTSVQRKVQASATRSILSCSIVRRSVGATPSNAFTATAVRSEAKSGMVASFGSQIMTL